MSRQAPVIDIVVPWVDGSDPEWQKVKAEYTPAKNTDVSVHRYRDCGLLHYLFRGIETFAPWVRTVHFVTWGHIPEWLDVNAPKLHIVRHEDYIPAQWLPTFSANPIELNFHRIDGLADRFIYFNDDMFLLKPVKPGDFFKNGLPADDAVLSPVMPIWGEDFGRMIYNDVNIINKHFDKNAVIKGNLSGFINLRYGTQLLRTLCLLPWHHFTGFYNDHIPSAFLKSTFEELWEAEEEMLSEVSSHRFRDYIGDVNQWLMRYWQFCKGDFVPASPKRGVNRNMDDEDTCRIIRKQRCKMICINDKELSEEQFEQLKADLSGAFESILPKKSRFEKD